MRHVTLLGSCYDRSNATKPQKLPIELGRRTTAGGSGTPLITLQQLRDKGCWWWPVYRHRSLLYPLGVLREQSSAKALEGANPD
jgi:hypothetical protein